MSGPSKANVQDAFKELRREIDGEITKALPNYTVRRGRPVSRGAVAGDTAVDVIGPDSGPRMILHNPVGPGTAKNSVHAALVSDHYDEETSA